MAKIKFGMMMTDASGKLGGQVFSKNRGGAYVRTKSTPINPQSSAQMGVRGIFASISSAWSALTDAQRESYNGSVSDYGRTDVFGDVRNPSGKNLFQRLNQNLINVGLAIKEVCPSPIAVPFANVDTATASIVSQSLFIDTLGDTTDCKLAIWATPQLSKGTKFVKNKLRQIAVIDGGTAVSSSVWAQYLAKFGQLQAGANVYMGVRVVNANGQASPLEVVRLSVSA